ncbi:hypothetical protein LZ198_23910 [Myxococcus sp. K15C18031901]|uniref:hypothetical protein n=1 Tax=Myxococcus dinghuensis TaxID=2906761 RepID=UPI0020A715AD|nr:hypothetical protein [Myxococcus dinghuensis]MCP3101916.1 hypothetical protein [Myxococcus dinghuensis]
MKKLMIGLLAASTLVFGAGCGGDVCDDLEDAAKALDDKLAGCGGSGGGDDEDYDKKQCEDALDSCSDSDKDKLSDLAKCIEDLPDCSQSNAQEWLAKLAACGDKAEGLSPSCTVSAE